ASQQSMPAAPLLAAFVPSNQTAVSQLANTYCGELLASQTLRDAFFGGNALDANLSASAATYFGTAANRSIVINALVANAVGSALPQAATAVQSEIDTMLSTRIPQLNPAATVQQATVAACTAVLGSAVVTLQ
ncbi:MAG TPA: hypothetical protein VEH54_06295, partial [Steroidobacteraceae bacterium]|nr:hypothetical protein [Steroidobacteraceae bacterium]